MATTQEVGNVMLDPREQVKKLQEMVRKLELQNEELRIGHKKNGFVDSQAKQVVHEQLEDTEGGTHKSTESLVNVFEHEDEEQTWLWRSSRSADDKPFDLESWLRTEVTANSASSALSQRLAQVKKSIEQQQLQQRQVDTRTFTRPKKRLVPEVHNEEVLKRSPLLPPPPGGSDDENTTPNGKYSEREPRAYSPKLDGTFRVERSATPERSHTPQTGLPMPRSRLDKTFGLRTSSPLGRTFHLEGRGMEGLEDDQTSSASDSSFSSSHRAALTAGEVKTLARMQEESLRFSSTPWKSHPEGQQPVQQLSCDLPSPITRSSEDCHSDHSEGRSSRSSAVGDSLHSSPAGSPFGSSQALVGFPRPTDGILGSNEALDRPSLARHVPNKLRVESVARGGLQRPRYSAAGRGSQEQQPQAGSSIKPQCLVRPSVQAGSGIPRPQVSRIPAPRTRVPAVRKTDWMDGCY